MGGDAVEVAADQDSGAAVLTGVQGSVLEDISYAKVFGGIEAAVIQPNLMLTQNSIRLPA